jgi:hypothetical protein
MIIECWVYAPSERQALANANGEDGYGTWDSEASALAAHDKPMCRLEGERLYRVVQTVAPVKRRTGGIPIGAKRGRKAKATP